MVPRVQVIIEVMVLTTDSSYVMDGITQWLEKRKRRRWQIAGKIPIKNNSIRRLLDDLTSPHEIDWRWVRGQSGHFENDRVDRLANVAVDRIQG